MAVHGAHSSEESQNSEGHDKEGATAPEGEGIAGRRRCGEGGGVDDGDGLVGAFFVLPFSHAVGPIHGHGYIGWEGYGVGEMLGSLDRGQAREGVMLRI